MKLIAEVFNDNCEVLTEATESGLKKYFIEGIFMQGNLKNRNGRIYPTKVLEKEMHRYTKEFINENRALGELGHPDTPAINPDRASHLITSMVREGDNFIGKAQVLSAPMGQIVRSFIDDGVKIGVSTRGLGSLVQREGIMEVQDDFHLATVDIVTDPSGPNCFVNGIMENKEYYFDIASGNWVAQQVVEEIATTAKTTYRRTVRKIDESYAIAAFAKFIKSLKN